jgi:hypothetical protein
MTRIGLADYLEWEARKATPAQRRTKLDGLMDEAIDSLKNMLTGKTKAYSGRAAQLALSLGVKPVRKEGETYVFRVRDLDAAAQALTPSQQALLDLRNWYEQGR